MTYLANILEQPQVLRSLLQTYKEHDLWRQIQAQWSSCDFTAIVLTGMGASFNALYPMGVYLHQQGIPAVHIETSELIHASAALIQQRYLMVVVSQSGSSIEIRQLISQVQAIPAASRPYVVSVTTDGDNDLAQQSNLQLYTHAGEEVGVATRTYTSTLLVLHLLARAITGQLQPQDYGQGGAIAAALDQVLLDWQTWIEPAWRQVESVSHLALIARGPSLASAMNGGLILKEAARLPAEGFSGGRFRHGPMELLSPQMGCLVFTTPGPTWALMQRLATDIASRGGQLVCIGTAIAVSNSVHLALPEVAPALSPALEILAVQLLAAQLASQKNIIPGVFRWGGKVVQVE